MEYKRFSIYMTNKDIEDLNRVRDILDPEGIYNRSELLRLSVRLVIAWHERLIQARKRNEHE